MTNFHQTTSNNKNSDTQTIETSSKLPDKSSKEIFTSSEFYDPFAYIEFEHNYAIMARQPVPIAKRLTIDGLHDMGVQIPIIIPLKPKFSPRKHDDEMRIMYEIDYGIDEEDMSYLKQSFRKYVLHWSMFCFEAMPDMNYKIIQNLYIIYLYVLLLFMHHFRFLSLYIL